MKNGHFDGCATPDSCWCEIKRYSLVFVLAAIIFIAEAIGGIISGSLALLADAGHVFTDAVAILVSIVAAHFVRTKRWHEHSVRGVGGIINALLLLVIAVWIGIEGIDRIDHPRDIVSETMIIIAVLGTLGNWAQYYVLGTLEKEHVTHKAMRLHILSDLLQSVVVVLGGIAIYFTDKHIIDPVLSVSIALWMAWRAWDLIIHIRNSNKRHKHHGHHHH
ncbi:MAG: cation transporter [Candidatus Yonathbacteria bacterium]|nr:cation transporter [Candidatus Yonathbacteria bacterium]